MADGTVVVQPKVFSLDLQATDRAELFARPLVFRQNLAFGLMRHVQSTYNTGRQYWRLSFSLMNRKNPCVIVHAGP